MSYLLSAINNKERRPEDFFVIFFTCFRFFQQCHDIMFIIDLLTGNDRLNALGVYLKIQNFKGAFIREGRLINRGVYLKMHKFIKQK